MMTRGRRRAWAVFGGVLAFALSVDTAAWWWTTGQIVQVAQSWRADREAEGFTVTTGQEQRTGWPVEAEVVLQEFTLGRPGVGSWHASKVRLVVIPWRPNVVTVRLEGPQSIEPATMSPIPVMAQRLEAVIPLDPDSAEPLDADLRNVSAGLAPRVVSLARLGLRLRGNDLTLSLQNLSLAALGSGAKLPFDGMVESFNLQAHATAAVAPVIGAPALAAWQKAGGRIDVSQMELRWGPMDATGTGSVGLDAALQPEGTGLLHITGYAEAIGSLERSGLMTGNDARVISTVLGLLSHTEPGKSPSVDLPVRLHSQVVSAGGFPLLRIPVLHVLR